MPCKVKLCFVGHARAGKTSTLLALADKPFHPMQPFLGVERIERMASWVASPFENSLCDIGERCENEVVYLGQRSIGITVVVIK